MNSTLANINNFIDLHEFGTLSALESALTNANATYFDQWTAHNIMLSCSASFGKFNQTAYIGTYYNAQRNRASVLLFASMNGVVLRGYYTNSAWTWNYVSMT